MDEVIALDGGRSFGLLTRAGAGSRSTLVVLLNPGLIHRTGPFRLHVLLARRLAAQGFDVFRFDLPRVGDAPGGSHASRNASVEDALDVVMGMTGSSDVVVGGLCSAADLGWQCAVNDTRVTGLLLIDGMAVRNHWFRIGQLGLLLRRGPVAWPGMISRVLRSSTFAGPGMMDFREWPEQGEFRAQLAKMLDRGTKVLAIYTGGVAYYMLHRRQLDETFGSYRGHSRLQVEYWPELDHMLFVPEDRMRMVDRISRWAVES